jgi:predicted outer membrane repeat protein
MKFFLRSSSRAPARRRFRPTIQQLEDRCVPALVTVTSLADSGPGSLRDTIAGAARGDLINFDGSLSGGTIVLTGGELLLSKNLTVTGPGAGRLTISSAGLSRVLDVAPGVAAFLSGLALADGVADQGGAIYNQGMLALDGVRLADNFAFGQGGAVFNTGTLRVLGSTLVDNVAAGTALSGGALYNAEAGTLAVSDSTLLGKSAGGPGGAVFNIGQMALARSTVQGNAAQSGGGIYTTGTLTLTDSTLSGNYASSAGGGLINTGTLAVRGSTLAWNVAANGGGFYNAGRGPATFGNSTLSGNEATASGGGIYLAFGTLTLTNVTVAFNWANGAGGDGHGGGLFVTQFLLPVLHNTLVADNVNGADGSTRDDVFGALAGGSDFNLIGDGTGMSGVRDGVNGNLVGTADAPIDPLLGPLQDNGGPTQTVALLPGSPALGAGSTAYATDTDQRGLARVVGGRIDIGAYQSQE